MKLDNTKKYVVACSFGPDSMFLVNFCIKQRINFIVAHVNYHRRPESNLEEENLRCFCKEKNIPLEVLDTINMIPTGNFQSWARKVRYEFFSHICDKKKCDAVLVAHNQDDLIETYLMQKEKNVFVSYYGISENTNINGVEVIRPLLEFKKKDLELQNINDGIPFSIDSSNLENHYRRNQIRHSIVEKLNNDERYEIIREINKQNKSLNIEELQRNVWDLQSFLREKTENLILQISSFLQSNHEFKILEKKEILNIQKSFSSPKPNIEIPLTRGISIYKTYEDVVLIKKQNYRPFEYKISLPGKYSLEFVDVDFSLGAQDQNVENSDYPLLIKSVKLDEKIKVKNYFSNVRRLYIDWKMPSFLRGWWPGIYNKNGELIYIPRYRAKYSDNHSSKFRIKFPTK